MNKIKSIFITSFLAVILCVTGYAGNITKPTKDDFAIANSIKLLMDINPIVNASNVTVSSLNKNVKLKGYTNSRTQYDEIISIANSLDTVKSTDPSNLTIQKSKDYIKDSYITGKIKGKLALDKVKETHQPNPFYVNVETVNGNVYLSGLVEDRNQAISAITKAFNTANVNTVTSYLKMSNDNESITI